MSRINENVKQSLKIIKSDLDKMDIDLSLKTCIELYSKCDSLADKTMCAVRGLYLKYMKDLVENKDQAVQEESQKGIKTLHNFVDAYWTDKCFDDENAAFEGDAKSVCYKFSRAYEKEIKNYKAQCNAVEIKTK